MPSPQAYLPRVMEALSHMERKVSVISTSGVAQGELGPRDQLGKVVHKMRPSWYARSFGTDTERSANRPENLQKQRQQEDVPAASLSVGAFAGRRSLYKVEQRHGAARSSCWWHRAAMG